MRAAGERRAAKVTSVTGLHIDGQFYAIANSRHAPPPLAITFHINPAGAEDKDGNPIPFNDLKTAMDACVAQWNSISDGHITFQVASTATTNTRNTTDSQSTVTFEDFPGAEGGTAQFPRRIGGIVTSDIRLNTDYKWNTNVTYPGSWTVAQPKDFRDVMTHELGHSIGLGHCDTTYRDNTMYYSSARNETKRRTLEWGDTAGGVYMTTSPGRTGDGVLDFDQDWSAFTGSGEEIILQQNIVAPSGKTLTLEPNLFIDMNGKTLSATAGVIRGNTAAAITMLSAEAREAAIRVTWQALSPAPGYYFIRYGTSSGSYDSYEVVDNATTSKVISSLTNGTQYYLGVNGSAEFTNIPSSCRSNYDASNQVIDLDDFFLYADHFGETPSDPSYEQQYDLSGNEEVDGADTGLFTNDYGKHCGAVPKALTITRQGGKNKNARARTKVQSDGEDLSVDVSLQNVKELTGYGLHLEYDPDVLVFQSFSDNGSMLLRHGREALLDVSLQKPGHLKFGLALKKGYRVEGSGLLARIQFRVRATYAGPAPVHLREVTLADVQRRVNRPISQRMQERGQSTETTALSAAPNPFNPATTIRFTLSQPMPITLEVYDVLGQRVNTLISNEYRQAGTYSVVWDGHDLSGKRSASGVYLVHLRAGDQLHKAKLTLVH